MQVPAYWAEGRAHHRAGGRQRTIRRFGWSDLDPDDAQRHADARAAEALARALAGERVPPRDLKTAYGEEGLPIREEILARHGDCVITRNAYGAHCLNAPSALFIDVDVPESTLPARVSGGIFLAVVVGLQLAIWGRGLGWHIGAFLISLVLAAYVRAKIDSLNRKHDPTPRLRTRERVDGFLRTHDDWRVRLYETPAGYRLLVTHRPFDPADPEAQAAMAVLGADPLYRRISLSQRCFRARVTGKPWRMGIARHIAPRPGVWPIKPERLADRRAWTDDYDRRAQAFAACRFVSESGQAAEHPEVAPVRALHDELSRALGDLPIA
ncbi:MAG: hypothetical protein J7598_08020 [Mitsuaria chitosanitabida]|uniref:hypothetical protein n=1 Tax=Roseateles chitosanitabidus TaxID=65048 RepID=UPI001B1A2385|nr:hypothetical protein [Roseateles chitosanitabidus]MBO9686543.1 hypothetical protein [Roseateles chitosanitabidus]